MPRLFVGTFLSEEGVGKIQTLSSNNERLGEKWNARIRWVAKDKLHITWLFLGEVKTEAIPDLISALTESLPEPGQEALTLFYDRFELWPSQSKARLGVITPSAVPDQVLITDAIIKKGLRPFIRKDQRQHERKNFQPHITVLRLSHDHHRLKSSGSANNKPRSADVWLQENIFPIKHEIDEIALIESDLGKQIQGYEKLARFRL